MSWQVDFSKEALKFLNRNRIAEAFVVEKIKIALMKFRGEDVNIDIRKLTGSWTGFYRIRSGKIRIIVEFQFDNQRAYIEQVDWRGNAYK
ncbi:MAG: hypothetical protein HY454_00115 [Parcubacteria group bacterium]|nr:hypothetical protein [Parcubacteria group bacterium]